MADPEGLARAQALFKAFRPPTVSLSCAIVGVLCMPVSYSCLSGLAWPGLKIGCTAAVLQIDSIHDLYPGISCLAVVVRDTRACLTSGLIL